MNIKISFIRIKVQLIIASKSDKKSARYDIEN
jgi:hypothetical protein